MQTRFEIPVCIPVRIFPQFVLFYLLFPAVFISCIAFYPFWLWLRVVCIGVLMLYVWHKALRWHRFWRAVQSLSLSADGQWRANIGAVAQRLKLLSATCLPGVALVFYFAQDQQKLPYVLFFYQLDAESARMLRITVKFFAQDQG